MIYSAVCGRVGNDGRFCWLVGCLLFVLSSPILGKDGSKVLAKLGQQSITVNEVDFQLGRRQVDANGKPLELAQLSPAALQTTIQLIAQQRQALQTLRAKNQAASREEVNAWLEANAQPPDGNKLKADEIVRVQSKLVGIEESRFRDHVAFRLSWQKYLAQQLTEKNIAKHFENQKRRFDGSRFRISMLAVAAPAGQSEQRQSVAKKLEAASAQLNDQPQAEPSRTPKTPEGKDDLLPAEQLQVVKDRWVRGVGDVDPAVVSALLKLKAGQVSPIVHAPTAVYLVKLIEVEDGDRTLEEARDDVRAHMLVFLLEYLANQSQKQLPLQVAS